MRPAGVTLSLASLIAASFNRTSDCFARSISQFIQLLLLLFEPTRTNKCVAAFIIGTKAALMAPAFTLSMASIRTPTVEFEIKIGIGIPSLQKTLVMSVFRMAVTYKYFRFRHVVPF